MISTKKVHAMTWNRLETILLNLGADREDVESLMIASADLEDSIDSMDRLLRDAGKTDFHKGKKDLLTRLEIIESCLGILHASHLGHTNTERSEFMNMHGFWPKKGEERPEGVHGGVYGNILHHTVQLKQALRALEPSESPEDYALVESVLETLAEGTNMEVVVR